MADVIYLESERDILSTSGSGIIYLSFLPIECHFWLISKTGFFEACFRAMMECRVNLRSISAS